MMWSEPQRVRGSQVIARELMLIAQHATIQLIGVSSVPSSRPRPVWRWPGGVSVGLSVIAWLLLAASVLAEVLGTLALRQADGFTRLVPSLLTATFYSLAIWLMSLSVRPA